MNPPYITLPIDSMDGAGQAGQAGQPKKRREIRSINSAGASLSQSELIKRLSEGMVGIIAGAHRPKARKASLAAQSSPLSVVASRRERRAKLSPQPLKRACRPAVLLTPIARRAEMAKTGKLDLTALDCMLADDEALALELWARCEQLLEGRSPSMMGASGGAYPASGSPIPDRWIARVNAHVACKLRLERQGSMLAVLVGFTAIQNGAEYALSPAQYGLQLFPNARHKQNAFLMGIADAGKSLLANGY